MISATDMQDKMCNKRDNFNLRSMKCCIKPKFVGKQMFHIFCNKQPFNCSPKYLKCIINICITFYAIVHVLYDVDDNDIMARLQNNDG